MAYSSAFLAGLLLAIMVLFNGMLSNYTSTYFSSFIFNAVGLIIFTPLLLMKKYHPNTHIKKPSLFFIFIPGALSALTIVISNTTMAELGITIMIGISLLGQVITSLFIDGFGLMGKQKVKISVKQLFSIVIMSIGVYLML